MKIINYIIVLLIAVSFTSAGCSLFKKKGPYDNMTHEEILQEQEKLKRQLDSLKNVKLDRELDSLKSKLDSSSTKLNKSEEELNKSQKELDEKTTKKK